MAPRPVPRVVITRKGEQAMRAELDRLRRQLDGQFTEEEAVLASRMRQLGRLLDSAEIVDEDSAAAVVAIGSIVEVRNLQSGAVREHRITAGFEPVQVGDVSANSPVGQSLLGRSPGERVEVELPGERSATLEVVAVGSDRPMARPALA